MTDGTSVIAPAQMGVGDLLFALPDSAVIVPANEIDTLTIVGDVDTKIADLDFRFAIMDSTASDVTDVVTGDTLLVGTINNVGYPLQTDMTHVLGSDLENGFTNYPNPFSAGNETTRITYYLEQASTITLKLYTVWGASVCTLAEKQSVQAGLHQDLFWSGVNGDGDVVNNGVYLLVLDILAADGSRQTFKRKVGVVR